MSYDGKCRCPYCGGDVLIDAPMERYETRETTCLSCKRCLAVRAIVGIRYHAYCARGDHDFVRLPDRDSFRGWARCRRCGWFDDVSRLS